MSMAGHLTPLTVLHLNVKSSFSTGSVNQMFQAAAAMAAQGHRTVIATRFNRALQEATRDAGVEFRAISFRNDVDIVSMIRLRRLIDEIRPDVIHVHKGRAHSLALAALTGNPAPALIVNRGVSFPLNRVNSVKYRSARVGRIVTVCESIRQTVIRTAQVDPDRVVTVFAGTDPARFDPALWDRNDFRREAGFGTGDFVVAHVGIRPWKGYREAMESFARFHRQVPGARLLLIGAAKPGELRRMRRVLEELGIREATVFTGFRSDMPRVLSACNVIMDASWDGTGITGTIREGMSLSIPVIATDCGGNRELVNSAGVGWIVPPRDVEALYQGLIEIHRDPARAEAVGRAARERILARFTVDHRIDHLGMVYKAAIAERASLGIRDASAARSV